MGDNLVKDNRVACPKCLGVDLVVIVQYVSTLEVAFSCELSDTHYCVKCRSGFQDKEGILVEPNDKEAEAIIGIGGCL